MRLDRGSSQRTRVEMIPLIDCVFILLVFFIYSMLTMTLQRGMAVELPTATAAATVRDESVVITITAAGNLLVDKEPVTLDGLGPAVDGILSGLREPRVVVNADTRSEHRWFVAVVDELKKRGITQVVVLSRETPTP